MRDLQYRRSHYKQRHRSNDLCQTNGLLCAVSIPLTTRFVLLCLFVGWPLVSSPIAADELAHIGVTTLADSGPGSLREAVRQGGRRITFRIKGTIELRKNIELTASNVVIDGSTAPQPGVTISDRTFAIADASHVHIRHLRFRNAKDDNLRIVGGCRAVLIENCSSTHGGDGAIDITHDYKTLKRPQDVTIRRCLIGATDKAMLVVGTDGLTLEQNLFTNNGQRNPQLHDSRNFNMADNLVRNFFIYGVRVRAGSTGNVVGNLIPISPNQPKRPDRTFILDTTETVDRCHVLTKNNVGPAQHDINRLGTSAAHVGDLSANILATEDAEATLIANVGARPLDAIDRELVRNNPLLKPRPSNTSDR